MRRPLRGNCPRDRFPGILVAVQGGPRLAENPACLCFRGQRHEIGERLVDYLGRFFSESALSERSSKSACAFPTTSRAAFVRARSAASFSFSFRSRSFSAAAASRAGRPGLFSGIGSDADFSRARRQSEISEE